MTQDKPVPKILVVDDAPTNIQLIKATLKKKGFQILAVTASSQALAVAVEKLPDLILLDIIMPEPDGFAVCRQLKAREETRDIPVIFLTGKIDEDSIRKARELGVAGYIAKPFNQEDLIRRVSLHVENRPSVSDIEEILEEKRVLEHELRRSRQAIKILKIQNLQTERKLVIAQIQAVGKSMGVVVPLLGTCQHQMAAMTRFVARELLSEPRDIVNLELASQACLVGFQGAADSVLIAQTLSGSRQLKAQDLDEHNASWERSRSFFEAVGLPEVGANLSHEILRAVSDYYFVVFGWPRVFNTPDKLRRLAKELLGAEGDINRSISSIHDIAQAVANPFIRRKVYPIRITSAILEYLKYTRMPKESDDIEWVSPHVLESGRVLAQDLVDKRGEFSLRRGTPLDDQLITVILNGFRKFDKIPLVAVRQKSVD